MSKEDWKAVAEKSQKLAAKRFKQLLRAEKRIAELQGALVDMVEAKREAEELEWKNQPK